MLVFIYGSIKEEYHNHHIIEGLKKTKIIVKTTSKYPLYNSESYCEYFPYLEDCKGVGHIIKGELYEIDPYKTLKALKVLDNFEGVPELYKRGEIEVVDDNGVKYTAYVYFRAENLKDYHNVELIDEYIG